jgi:hypothetical protein
LVGKCSSEEIISLQKFIAGIGIPIDLTPESMTVGYVLKAQYFLPFNETQLYPTRFRKRDTQEHRRSQMIYNIVGQETDIHSSFNKQIYFESFNDNVRWGIYKILAFQLQKVMKADGIRCIQKYICEASQLPFTYKTGLLSEILHILLV